MVNKERERERSASTKRRRLPRACDMCKKRKIRCDGLELSGNRCSNCRIANTECTHVEVMKSLGSAKDYVETLERRIDKLIKLFKKHLPDVDINRELDEDQIDATEREGLHVLTRNDESQIPASLSFAMSKVVLEEPERRFFGPSNGLYFIQSVSEMKAKHLGRPVSSLYKREDAWALRPWHDPWYDFCHPIYVFPEEPLMTSLVELYFTSHSPYYPLLHRPTFLKLMSEHVHLYEPTFGAVLLLVCALGSLYTTDPRVFADGIPEPGFRFFAQVVLPPPSCKSPVSLYEIQLHCLFMMYMHTLGGMPDSLYILSGNALRLVIDAGRHVKRHNLPNTNDELWKRAFWIILWFDTIFLCLMGRPITLNYEDFDLDLPLECDDEYWDHANPEQNFKQPPGVPSSVAYFIETAKLIQIACLIKRLIYPTRRRLLHDDDQARFAERQTLTKIDAMLQEWERGLPEHLRWYPQHPSAIFFRQASFLRITLSYFQILTHRPFVTHTTAPGASAAKQLYPSMGICLSAARMCAKVVAAQKGRGLIEDIHVFAMVNTAGVVLLLAAWSGPRRDEGLAESQNVKDAQTCLSMMQDAESAKPYRISAHIFGDMLVGLMPDELVHYYQSEHPQSFPSERQSRKRQRNIPGPGIDSGPGSVGPTLKISTHHVVHRHDNASLATQDNVNEYDLQSFFAAHSGPGPLENQPIPYGVQQAWMPDYDTEYLGVVGDYDGSGSQTQFNTIQNTNMSLEDFYNFGG